MQPFGVKTAVLPEETASYLFGVRNIRILKYWLGDLVLCMERTCECLKTEPQPHAPMSISMAAHNQKTIAEGDKGVHGRTPWLLAGKALVVAATKNDSAS